MILGNRSPLQGEPFGPSHIKGNAFCFSPDPCTNIAMAMMTVRTVVVVKVVAGVGLVVMVAVVVVILVKLVEVAIVRVGLVLQPPLK